MTVESPRVFIADFDLVEYSGHFFNQVFGFREAARARGLAARIYISRRADPEIAEELGAQAILPFIPWLTGRYDGALEGFASAQHILGALWSDLDTAQISERDILVITSSRPQVIYGVDQWLRARPASARPAVIFRFLGPEFFNFEAEAFREVAWAYRFASRILLGSPSAERIFFTLNNEKALAHLEQLSSRRAFYLPVPKHYGAMAASSEARAAQPFTIYIYVNTRSGQISDRIIELLNKILSQYSDVNFLVRFSKGTPGEDDIRKKTDKSFIGARVEILPAEQNHAEYLATIERSDVVLLPYSPVVYRGIVSGVFCEIVAMGKIAVIPAGTWMADHVTEGRAAGVLFAENTVTDMVEAVERTIRDRSRLQTLAHRYARPFREENSCAKNLDGMLKLAGQRHDLRLSYVSLTDATKALGSQFYLGEGWSQVEEGMGVWSDGDRAEINFSLRPEGAKALFFNVQVRPFLAKWHSRIDVSVTANDVPVGEWSLNTEGHGGRHWSWHHAQIPEEVTASDEIQIVLSIRSPVSPKELGLSSDIRKLGIALRQFSLTPEMQSHDLESSEKSSMLARLREWLKRKLR
jgi:glycosyltransferase involved in cell wall biosynthesis